MALEVIQPGATPSAASYGLGKVSANQLFRAHQASAAEAYISMASRLDLTASSFLLQGIHEAAFLLVPLNQEELCWSSLAFSSSAVLSEGGFGRSFVLASEPWSTPSSAEGTSVEKEDW